MPLRAAHLSYVPTVVGSLRWAGGDTVAEPEQSTPRARALSRRRRENVEGGRLRAYKVRVSPEEAGRLERLAQAGGVSVPRLLMESALSSQEPATTRREALSEMFAAYRLLAGLANNVNQIARVSNATGTVPPWAPTVMAKVRRTAERIDAAIDAIEGGGRS